MVLERTLAAETPTADIALVLLLAQVVVRVVIESEQAGEGLVANDALVYDLPVYLHMALQVPFLHELLVADDALVPLDPFVDVHVHLQTRFKWVLLVAQNTLVLLPVFLWLRRGGLLSLSFRSWRQLWHSIFARLTRLKYIVTSVVLITSAFLRQQANDIN